MERSYQRRIDSIVDMILDGKNKISKKIVKEQEKMDMSMHISKAISVLNDDGKKLVLDELTVQATQKSVEIFDSNGDINISELKKITSTIVKTTMEEAARYGIDLTENGNRSRKDNLVEGIFTIALVNEMIKNYQNLTYEEERQLLDNYSKLSRSQQRAIDENIKNKFKAFVDRLPDEFKKDYKEAIEIGQKEITSVEERSRLVELLEKVKEGGNLTTEEDLERKKLLEKYPDVYDSENETINEAKVAELNSKSNKTIVVIREIIEEINKLREKKYKTLDDQKRIEELEAKLNEISQNEQKSQYENKNAGSRLSQSEEKENNKDGSWIAKEDNKEVLDRTNMIFDKIRETGFSKEKLEESLKKYIFFLKEIEENDISDLKKLDEDRLNSLLKNIFCEIDMEEDLQTVFIQITSSSQIFSLLIDNKLREEFIQELDKQIESLEPEKEEEQPQEEVDMESVKEELSAIPKALVSIDASTQDIAEGMQGYKQLIDNLDTKEIEGKSNEDVLKVLASKVSEIALSGNANLILEMMTQIGFSGLKNSEMKISPILTTVKSEFVQMIDDVSKEEYIEKTRNEMLAKEPIKDAEAEPGMKSFMVDLRVATKERNDLTNQIIGKDEKQDNITGSSDSDATQGSTSSGKISLQNMMNTVQNVRMSEIQNVQDLMVSIVKENTEKIQEQDELVQDEEQDMV